MQQRSSGVRGLVFGGVMAALVVVCALIPVLSPFMPIPLVLVYVRFGGRVTMLTSVVAALFAAMIVGPVQAFLYLVPGGILPGLVFGYGIRRKLKPLITGILAVVVFFFGFASEYVVTRAFVMGGRDPFVVALEKPEVKQQVTQVLDTVEQLFQAPADATPEQKQAMERALQPFEDMKRDPVGTTWNLLPLSLFMIGAGSSWLNYMLCRLILPRFGHEVPKPTPFGEFRLPVWSTWAFMLVLLATQYLGGSLTGAPWGVHVLQNIVPPLVMIFVLSGMSVGYGFMRKKNVPKPAAVAFTIFGLFLGALGQQLYLMLATLDPIFDFRGLGHGLWRRPEGTS